jgi:uncharacterized protein
MRPRALAILSALVTVAGLGVAVAAAAPTDLLISEYIEGSSNNKAVELYNGTGAPIDLAANAYSLQVFFNGSATAGLTINLTGTVATDDVYVFAHSGSVPAILAQADQTSGAGLWNGDDAITLRRGTTVIDSIGQVGVDPGTEWGSGLASTADNTLRRKATVEVGDTVTNDAFDPATEWDGFAIDTFDGLGAHLKAVVACNSPLLTVAGVAATHTVTAADPDDTIVDLAVTAVSPAPAAGSISRTAFSPASGPGAIATATVTATADVPAGTYAVTMTSTDADGTTGACALEVKVVAEPFTVGEVQGPTADTADGKTDQSEMVGDLVVVRGVVTQRTLARTSSGAAQHGFFLQSRLGTEDGDPLTSDGIFVFMGGFTSLIGGYVPTVGDEVLLRARVAEFFNLTQLTGAFRLATLDSGVDVNTEVEVTDAIPPADLAAADRFWERHEGARIRVRAGSAAVSGRDVFASTADAETWLVDRDDPLLDRADPYARRVFRDAHPLDNNPGTLFDDENGQRIMIGPLGLKAQAGDNSVLLPPTRTFDRLTGDAVGGLYFAFEKYGVQVEQVAFAAGTDPSGNAPPRPAVRSEEFAVSSYNVENLYDFRDDPFDGCDFLGNTGCPGVNPPFDYVPASAEEYNAQLAALADQIRHDLHSPDVILVQEAEDQDICAVSGGALVCGATDNADGKPDTLQELAVTIAAAGGPAYDAAYDRDGADDRGITAAFLYRTDRVSLAPATTGDPVLGASPTVVYRAPGLAYNGDVQNPKSLNADLPSDVDTSTGVDGSDVYTRAPQVAKFLVAATPGGSERAVLWAVSNHFSSTPDARVGQRREQAAYGAAIVDAVESGDANARVVYGGDLNVFPRPDEPIQTAPGDQLGPLYRSGLHNLWDDLVAQVPASAYSYVFEGQAQTLDHLFVNPALRGDLVQMRAAHVNADWPANHAGDGSRGSSDHDPQVARFRSRASLSVADASVAEGDTGTTPLAFTVTLSRPLSQAVLLCATTIGLTARAGSDYDPLVSCRTVAVGQTTTTFTVNVRGDTRPEADERLTLLVAGVPGLRLADPVAIGTILDDD